jgi:two-component system, LytTR family, sensor kinase
MNTSCLVDEPKPPNPWRRLIWPWVAFWLVMLAVGIQESLWTGELRFWRPLVNSGTSALGATVLLAVQMRRTARFDRFLNRPLQWFLRAWAWMPLQMIAYITAMYAMRIGIYALGGLRYEHGPWREILAYEATTFILYYALFGGIHFGVRSYLAWAAERLRTEQQATLAREAQLARLTQQLQPHFLFNALNTISALIHSNPDAADRVLTRLATLLRAATDAGQRPEQSLAEELTLLRAYADIMAQRFADRVQISWDVDDAAQNCRVPTLGLQPLLENCFRHVVEQRNTFTHIVIRTQLSDGMLHAEIEDDGDLQQLPTARGVGLGNLADRLQSLYGARASLELKLRPDGGLIAGMRLPCAR